MVGSDDLARELAKPTDQRDVHTYVHKETVDGQARILSLIRPAKYPERLRPLLNALSAARAGLIEVTAVDATLGEALVAFASAGIEHGVAVMSPQGEWINEDMVKSLFKQAGLSKWTFEKADGIELRNAFGIWTPSLTFSHPSKSNLSSFLLTSTQRQGHWIGCHRIRSIWNCLGA